MEQRKGEIQISERKNQAALRVSLLFPSCAGVKKGVFAGKSIANVSHEKWIRRRCVSTNGALNFLWIRRVHVYRKTRPERARASLWVIFRPFRSSTFSPPLSLPSGYHSDWVQRTLSPLQGHFWAAFSARRWYGSGNMFVFKCRGPGRKKMRPADGPFCWCVTYFLAQ
jgi:hypothetical protein